ncbi:hypothetical protein AB0D74_46160 [Streptomyces sp. NPDC048278]|uniref:hypothetical protein n=1 Tax=Streptomyces sp. NPDC048278 TaxID=3155809 RepID=UPI003429B94A
MQDTALLVIDMQRAMLRDAQDGEACLEQVAHHNAIFSVIRYAGRSVTVAPAAEVRFDASPAV